MKKITLYLITFLLTAAMLTACGKPTDPQTPVTEPSTAEADTASDTTEASVTEATEEDIVYEGDASSYYIDHVYHEQIGRYYTALSEKWDEGKYFENEMSALPYYYYEGDPLENVGFGFVDLDNDGH